LTDVTLYADSSAGAPKITMKLYSSAPVGTIVHLQLGLKSIDNYPAGIHSEYSAITTVKNAWQNLTFTFSLFPIGSLVSATNIDKVVILFNPNTASRDTMYFDDLIGPQLINFVGVPEHNAVSSFSLHQNSPNPAKESTHIDFQLNSSGMVSLTLYDLLGNSVSSLLEQNMKEGAYSIPFETATIPNGIYFYVLKKEGDSRTVKMIVSK